MPRSALVRILRKGSAAGKRTELVVIMRIIQRCAQNERRKGKRPGKFFLPMKPKVGRVTPCAPIPHLPTSGAHGVTRPTTVGKLRGARRDLNRRALFCSRSFGLSVWCPE